MRSLSIPVLVVVALLAFGPAASAQAPLIDRAAGTQTNHARLGVQRGFLGDHFEIGVPGEVWIVDRIAVWTVQDPDGRMAEHLGDLYTSVKLFGGIEAQIPAPGQPVPPDCACHNLVVLKSGKLASGSDTPDTGEVRVSREGSAMWRVEFADLKWSVPGGVPLQFGVLGLEQTGDSAGLKGSWFNRAAAVGGTHDLRLFDENGRLLRRYAPDGARVDPSIGFNVQVWGHRSSGAAQP